MLISFMLFSGKILLSLCNIPVATKIKSNLVSSGTSSIAFFIESSSSISIEIFISLSKSLSILFLANLYIFSIE